MAAQSAVPQRRDPNSLVLHTISFYVSKHSTVRLGRATAAARSRISASSAGTSAPIAETDRAVFTPPRQALERAVIGRRSTMNLP